MANGNESENNVPVMPVADISLTQDESGIIQTESIPVIPKNKDINDFARPIKMSDLRKISSKISHFKKNRIHWDEIALGISTLGFGGTISALLSKIKIDDPLGILFYIVLPIISFSLIVFLIMFKILHNKIDTNISVFIEEIINPYINEDDKE